MPFLLADAIELARNAVRAVADDAAVGAHRGVVAEGEWAASHRFAARLPGYRGWEWNVVVAACPGADSATVSELALLPGADALLAPPWIPWEDRVQSGDLMPGDLLPPKHDDERLVPGYLETGDPAVDEAAGEIGLGRQQLMSREGRLAAAERWSEGDFGPRSPMAAAAPAPCATCGFYLPLEGALRAAFGVCGNEYSADGHVVHAGFGCGAHSDTELPSGAGSPQYDPFDDGVVEVVDVPGQRD
ncbi:DUF3027 domain-containing protein [Hoyosella sp. YIM 151337]|nr:DUF3027 domain-containing protein [Hoyosella sp. YIM 151337]